MPYIHRYNEDSFKIKYTIKYGGFCPDFVKPHQEWDTAQFQTIQQQWAATLLGFLLHSKPDLRNVDCQRPLSKSAYTSYAKETRHTAAQILKLLVYKAWLGSRLMMISSDRQEEGECSGVTPGLSYEGKSTLDPVALSSISFYQVMLASLEVSDGKVRPAQLPHPLSRGQPSPLCNQHLRHVLTPVYSEWGPHWPWCPHNLCPFLPHLGGFSSSSRPSQPHLYISVLSTCVCTPPTVPSSLVSPSSYTHVMPRPTSSLPLPPLLLWSYTSKRLQTTGSHSVMPRLTWVLPEILRGRFSGPHRRPSESKTLRTQGVSALTSSPGDADDG